MNTWWYTWWSRGFLSLAIVIAAGCAASRSAAEGDAGAASGETTPLMSHNDANLQTYRIDNWTAPNERSLIVESIDGSRYRAQFMSRCIGLNFVNAIGFVTRGINQLDQFSGIVLPDGTRCTFRSFERIPSAERSAEAGTGDEEAGRH